MDEMTLDEYHTQAERRGKSVSAGSINRAIEELIILRGGLAWRNNSGSLGIPYTTSTGRQRQYRVRLGPKGSGDVLGLYRGRFLSIETKTLGDAMTDDQRDWARRVRKCGGIALEDVRGLDEVIAALDALDAVLNAHGEDEEAQS